MKKYEAFAQIIEEHPPADPIILGGLYTNFVATDDAAARVVADIWAASLGSLYFQGIDARISVLREILEGQFSEVTSHGFAVRDVELDP